MPEDRPEFPTVVHIHVIHIPGIHEEQEVPPECSIVRHIHTDIPGIIEFLSRIGGNEYCDIFDDNVDYVTQLFVSNPMFSYSPPRDSGLKITEVPDIPSKSPSATKTVVEAKMKSKFGQLRMKWKKWIFAHFPSQKENTEVKKKSKFGKLRTKWKKWISAHFPSQKENTEGKQPKNTCESPSVTKPVFEVKKKSKFGKLRTKWKKWFDTHFSSREKEPLEFHYYENLADKAARLIEQWEKWENGADGVQETTDHTHILHIPGITEIPEEFRQISTVLHIHYLDIPARFVSNIGIHDQYHKTTTFPYFPSTDNAPITSEVRDLPYESPSVTELQKGENGAQEPKADKGQKKVIEDSEKENVPQRKGKNFRNFRRKIKSWFLLKTRSAMNE